MTGEPQDQPWPRKVQRLFVPEALTTSAPFSVCHLVLFTAALGHYCGRRQHLVSLEHGFVGGESAVFTKNVAKQWWCVPHPPKLFPTKM